MLLNLQITAIAPGGASYNSGLQVGDQITHINSIPVNGSNIEELKRLTSGDDGTVVILTVRRGISAAF